MNEFLVSLLAGAIAGVVAGPIAAYVARGLTLSRALRVEARGARKASNEALPGVRATKRAAQELLALVKNGSPIAHRDIAPLDSGWVLTSPKIDFVELASWIPAEDGYFVSQYLDRWARFSEYERRYCEYLARALSLLPEPRTPTSSGCTHDAAYPIELLEQLTRVAGCAEVCESELRALKAASRELTTYRYSFLTLLRVKKAWATRLRN